MDKQIQSSRKLTIVVQDPSIKDKNGNILTAQVNVPAEDPSPGPRGYRIHVIDYDASTKTLYKPLKYPAAAGSHQDPFQAAPDATILGHPGFHAQNVYAVAMRTLARFEFALGRRVAWGFDGHQLKIAPHAFAGAHAFYSRFNQALMFGYFPSRLSKDQKDKVFTCLSHDVIAHETTHAILDGLRERYMEPSSPDQAAFHESFADIVALLSVFSIREFVEKALETIKDKDDEALKNRALVDEKYLTAAALRESFLCGLADQLGPELTRIRGSALRRAGELTPSKDYLKDDNEEFTEPHRRGEILAAAVMNSLIEVLEKRVAHLRRIDGRYIDRHRVAEEAAECSDYLLTMVIRALDYMPPVHISFGGFLSAMLTADMEIRPNDSKYGFRAALRNSFESYGINSAAEWSKNSNESVWEPVKDKFCYDRVHFDSMLRDRNEMFRFIRENRKPLRLYDGAYTRVISVRPCLRIAPDDGFPLRETVAEVFQQLLVTARELKRLKIEKPAGMPDTLEVELLGGTTLIFDEYGKLKYTIGVTVYSPTRDSVKARQSKLIKHLWEQGHYEGRAGGAEEEAFAELHRRRSLGLIRNSEEEF
jgi:hypothetical protein